MSMNSGLWLMIIRIMHIISLVFSNKVAAWLQCNVIGTRYLQPEGNSSKQRTIVTMRKHILSGILLGRDY